MNKRIRFWLILGLIVAICGGGIGLLFSLSNRAFIQKMTGIRWPLGTEIIYIQDDPSFIHPCWIEAAIRLSPAGVSKFIGQGFSQFDASLRDPKNYEAIFADENRSERFHAQMLLFGNAKSPLHFLVSEEHLSDEARKTPFDSNLYFKMGDLTGENRFTIVVDTKSRMAWIQVMYPD